MAEYRLGDLQLRIMQVLWDHGGSTGLGMNAPGMTVSGVHEALRQTRDDRQLAYTTIATMLRKMEDRGLVTHESQGRKFIYRAAVAADEVTRSMAGHVLDRLFEGSLADMVHHMLTEREVSQEELSRLELLIAERKRSAEEAAMAVSSLIPQMALDTVVVLAAGTAVIAAVGHLAAQRLRSPAWQRAVWQMVLLGVAGLTAAEAVGLSSCLAHLAAIGHVGQAQPVGNAARAANDGSTSRASKDVEPAIEPRGIAMHEGASLAVNTLPIELPEEAKAGLPLASSREGGAQSILEPRTGTDASLEAPPTREPAPSQADAVASAPPLPGADHVPRTAAWHGVAAQWFVIVWVAGIVLLGLLRAGVGSLLLWRSSRRLRPLEDDSLTWSAHVVSRRLGMRRAVRLREAAGLSAPMAWGILRPTIALPPGFAEDYGPTEQQAMLAHELAHLRGADPLWQRLADWLAVVLWWHPAAWWARRQWQAASERAADDASLVVDGGPELLAECLVQLGGRVSGARPLGSLGMRGGFRSHLGRRVERLLSLGHERWRPPGRLLWAKLLIPVAAVAAATFCTSWARSEASYQGEADMSMVKHYWRQSVLGVAVVAALGAADRALAVDAPDDEAVVAAAQDQDRPPAREGGEREGDRPKGDRREGDRPREGVKRDGDRPPLREGEKRDGDRPKGDRRDGDRPPPKDGDRREGGRPGDRPPVGEGDRPRPSGGDLERQLQHLRAAADNLEAAGRREDAERIRREIAERTRKGGDRPGFGPGRPEGGPREGRPEGVPGGRPGFTGGPPELIGMIRQLQEEVAQLRREMAEMRRMMPGGPRESRPGEDRPGESRRPEGRPDGDPRKKFAPGAEGPPKRDFRPLREKDPPRKEREEPRREGRAEGEEETESAPPPQRD